MGTIVDCLEHWAAAQPDKCLYSFLGADGREKEAYSYLGFHERTRHLAEYLSKHAGLKPGDRALLVYPPGIEVIVAFFACARIGVIPVPVHPPTPLNFDASLAKLAFVARDCEARAALTTRGTLRSCRFTLAGRGPVSPWRTSPKLDWITTDDVRGVASGSFTNAPGATLFLQYTSGSTTDPKGVIVSHENVLHNCGGTLDHVPTCVSWLPQYHDMGLIGYYLYPLIAGGTTYGFSPLDFLKRPPLWFQMISRVRATYTSAPNFAYEYCLRKDKVPDEDVRGLDLGSLRVMMNAAEPVSAETFARFLARFSPLGLRHEAHVVAYGLAENTLCVSHHGRQILTVNKARLQQRQLLVENGRPQNNNQIHLVSCGRPLDGVRVRIVDPDTRAPLGEKRIGEIWVTGKSVCGGYWRWREWTLALFGATVSNDPADRHAYLRTGDLGFLYEGELFVCGRIKDLIIIHGVNYYPQDIERIVESVSGKIRLGGVAAFDVDDGGGGSLVVVAEVKKPSDLPDLAEIARAIRRQYYVEPHTIALVRSRSIAKTTSGKTSRTLTRERWLNGKLSVIASRISAREVPDFAEARAGIRGRFQHLIELYNLTGREECSFADIGVDSLTSVEIIEGIKRLLEEHGHADLIEAVDARLFQRLTVAEFFSLLDRFDDAPDRSVATLLRVLGRVQREHERHERACMRSDAKLEPFADVGIRRDEGPVTDVLLTGATGFFGPFLMGGLLRQTQCVIHVLVRATDSAHGIDRIRAALRRARLWAPGVEEALGSRVRVVCGDIARHNLGLGSEQWTSLASTVQAVMHNAALVNYVMSYDALRPHNVDGARELLRFAFSGVQKEFHHISSTFIFGWTAGETAQEADDNAGMENLDFGYAQSKWVAEQLVLQAEKQGLGVRLYRPAFLSSSTEAAGSRDDVAIRLLAFMVNHGIAVESSNQISFLPADIAADNIVAIFKQRHVAARTFHVTVDNYYNMADVTRAITNRYGYPFAYYDIPRFVAEMNRRCTTDDLIYPLLDFINRSHAKISAMQDKRYINDAYRRAREASGCCRADPSVDETVGYQMEFMLRDGIIARAPAGRGAVSLRAES